MAGSAEVRVPSALYITVFYQTQQEWPCSLGLSGRSRPGQSFFPSSRSHSCQALGSGCWTDSFLRAGIDFSCCVSCSLSGLSVLQTPASPLQPKPAGLTLKGKTELGRMVCAFSLSPCPTVSHGSWLVCPVCRVLCVCMYACYGTRVCLKFQS